MLLLARNPRAAERDTPSTKPARDYPTPKRSITPIRLEVVATNRLDQAQRSIGPPPFMVRTLPITVKETLTELGLRSRDHQQYIDRIDDRLGDWFFRIHTPVDKGVVDAIFDDFIVTVQQMVDISHKFKAKNIEQHCNWCEFEPICRAELEGSDVDYVIQHDYYVHKGDEYENAIIEA